MTQIARYVRAERRADGTDRVVFYVPQSHRPPKWPVSITLPELGGKGSLDDPKFRARVLKDAHELNATLDIEVEEERRASNKEANTVAHMAAYYYESDAYLDLSPGRKKRNKGYCERVIAWSESLGNPPVQDISVHLLQRFLNHYLDTPSVRHQMQHILYKIYTQAVSARLLSENPVSRIDWKQPVVKLKALWKQEDVDHYGRVCNMLGQPGLAALIRVGFVIGQRLVDLRNLQYGISYREEALFGIRQTKTGAFVPAPIPEELVALIQSVRQPASPYLFNDGVTGLPFSEVSLGVRFKEVQSLASVAGKPKLLLQTLRHSCVCRLLEAGNSMVDTASVTGHSLNAIHLIMEHYAIRSDENTRRAIVKTHIYNGGSADDFRDNAKAAQTWYNELSGVSTFEYPDPDTHDFEAFAKKLGIRRSVFYGGLRSQSRNPA